jgi:hypothetical protein
MNVEVAKKNIHHASIPGGFQQRILLGLKCLPALRWLVLP